MNIRVAIYERVRDSDGWHERHVPMPRRIKRSAGGYTLYSKDDREGTFLISWYENRKKKRQAVEGRWLSDAVKLAVSKQWYLNSSRHGVKAQDPTTQEPRPEIFASTDLYLAAKSGCGKTLSAHRLALREFREFCATEGIAYVDEVSSALMRKWYEELLDGGNVPFTAANKFLKVNSFCRKVLRLDPGKGIITKKDYRRELASSRVPEIYTKAELDALFSNMDDDDHLLFSTIREAALRKKEAMHLEDVDLIHDEIAPGKFKCEVRVQPKPHWGYMPKTGQTRNVLISKELMDRLQQRKAAARPSRLLFGTREGKPDFHFWDRLKAVAKKAGLDPATVWIHKLRATAATHWLRSKGLGGMGWDIGFVRQQLGHDDYRSIERYISIVKNEEVALRMQPPAEASAAGKDGAPQAALPDGKEIPKIRGEIAARNPDAFLLEGYGAALIGITVEQRPRAVYSREGILKEVRKGCPKGLSDDEAEEMARENLDHNVLGIVRGIDEENRPVIVDTSIVG
jgi:integrase